MQPREFSEDAPEGGSPIGERNSSVLSEEVAGDNSLSKAMPIPSPSPKPAKKDNWKFENGSEKEFHAYMGIIETMSRISLLLKEFDEAELEIPVGTMARITHNNRVKKYILQQGEGDFYLGLRWAQAAVLATRDRCKWQKSKADDTAAKWFKPCIYSIFSKNIPAKLHQQIKEYVMGNKMRTIGYDYEADKSHYTDLLESARENAKNGVD